MGEQGLPELLPQVAAALEGGEAWLAVPDPDRGAGLYPGEPLPGGRRHRSWSTWHDVATALGARLHTPRPHPQGLLLRLTPLPPAQRFGGDYSGDFARIDKREDPHFLVAFAEALARLELPAFPRVLALGPGQGHELSLLRGHRSGARVLAVDRDPAALAACAAHGETETLQADLADFAHWLPTLGPFDAVLALSVLQSPGVPRDPLLYALRREHLSPGGGFVLGFPNAHYRGGELVPGARMRNFARPDLSLLVRDVAGVRRHLQGHGFAVWLTGQHELLLTARQCHGSRASAQPKSGRPS